MAKSTKEQPRDVAEIPTFTTNGLSRLQWAFAHEFIADASLNATEAYLRAAPNVTRESARAEASRMLAIPNVAREIQRLMDERSAITGITADRVLFKLWERATADPRELVEYRIGSCRHCHGLYSQYQYTDAEFSKAQDEHIAKEAKRRKAEKDDFVPREFPEKGGSGFDPNRPPNPDCPECWGDGTGRTIIHDTRQLSPAGVALYAGVKTTKDGLNVQMHSPTEALQLIGRHLGMWNDKVKIVDETNPLQALIQQIQASHSTLPIVHDDPERRDPGQVQDVEARPVLKKEAAPGAALLKKEAQKWRAA